ncbi:MAG: WecB/TagA/CpsF family glycosyltransferase [Clostridiales bacterium]|nr:WecB/TagA/CpsF family glycosyltransferase [Clostridiales bacterium]
MNILGVRIDKVNMNEAVEKAKKCLEEEKLHMIFTPNPEMIINANEDEEFKTILNSSFLNIPDGNGVVWASKQIKEPLEERVAGFDFIHRLFGLGKDNDVKFYFLGSKPGIAEKAKENLENTHEYIKIIGVHDGYFGADEELKIIEDINSKNPDVLLVALGSPKQEKFIYKYRDKLNCKIAIGVGGCFDVISGTVKRAPKIFIKLKLEWLYRGLTDLKRIKRLMAIPKFMMKVCRDR